MQINKRLETTLNYLGSEYCIRVIDCEECIYRDLGNGYDIEICGFHSRRRKNYLDIYVWKTKEGLRIVESMLSIGSLNELRIKLDKLAVFYGKS